MAKILIVEDNAENSDVLSRRLERRGFDIVLAEDGELGIAAARSQAPDLILMDMNMPKLDGWEATRLLKAAPETCAIPVIALTAHDMDGDREKALSVGCNDHHPKPFDLPKLLSQIDSLLNPTSQATSS